MHDTISADCKLEGLCRDPAFRRVASLGRDLMAVLCDGAIQFINEAGARLLGASPEDLVGKPIAPFLQRDYLDVIGANLAGAEAEAVVPVRMIRADGLLLDVELSLAAHPCLGHDATILVARDIGPDKKRAIRSRLREEHLSGVLQSVADGIVTIDHRGRIQTFNAAAERIFGWTAAEAIGMNVSRLMPEPHASRHDGYLGAYLVSGLPRIIGKSREVVGQRRDGTPFPMDLSVTELRTEDARLFIGVIRDLADRKRLEREHATLRDQLYHSQKMEAVALLASGIAHDFNNILNAMMGCADNVLERLEPHSPVRGDVEQILNSGWRAAEIVNQLLTFARQGPKEVHPVLFDQIVREVEGLVRASLPRAIRLAVELAPGPMMVMADNTQLFQVITNLCVNARQAMGRGPGTLTMTLDTVDVRGVFAGGFDSCCDGSCPRKISVDEALAAKMWVGRLQPGPHARLTIGDTGCGMDAATLGRVFEPFFTTKGPGEGTGLGLAVAHGIVTGIGGGIVVATAPGSGTAFSVLLPLLRDA